MVAMVMLVVCCVLMYSVWICQSCERDADVAYVLMYRCMCSDYHSVTFGLEVEGVVWGG